jgi:hypothetical protein
VWKKAETSDKLGEDRWPRITWNHKISRRRIKDEGKASKEICSMKVCRSGRRKCKTEVVTDITFITQKRKSFTALEFSIHSHWSF